MRVAVVVQRYGAEILGGAETHAALMAGILARRHDVEVLTTTAGDYHEWKSAYPPGVDEVAGIRVRRFPVAHGRAPAWGALNRLLHDGFDSSEFPLLPEAVRRAHAERLRAWPDALQEAFIRGQGPDVPELHAHLRRSSYDRVLFVTYLYPTTYDGLAAVSPGVACIVPTLHDEPPAYLPVFGRRLERARLLCSTESEVRLVARLYPEGRHDVRCIGYGIDLPPDPGAERGAPTEKPFLLYAGRIDVHKGVPRLLRWYRALRNVLRDSPRLVLIGEVAMPLGHEEGVEVRGFVAEEEKLRLMRDAVALVHLSPYESLGIVVLEALGSRTPVLVHADCEVMVEHCRRSGAGLWLRDAGELIAAVRRLMGDAELRRTLGARGRTWVEREFATDAYAERLLSEIERDPGPTPPASGVQFTSS